MPAPTRCGHEFRGHVWHIVRLTRPSTRLLHAATITFSAISAVAAFSSSGWPAAQYRDGDFFQFWAGARAVVSGASPYDLSWWSALHHEYGSRALLMPPQPPAGPAWTTPYALPLFVLLAPLGALPFAAAAAAWLVVQVGLVGGAGALITTLVSGGADQRRSAFLLAGTIIAMQSAWLLVGGGNVTGAFLMLLTAATVMLARGRYTLAGALLGMLLLKPHPFILTGMVAVMSAGGGRKLARLISGGVLTVGALMLAAFALDPGWPPRWWGMVTALQGSHGSNATIWTLGRILPIPSVSVVMIALGTLAIFAVWARRVRPPVRDLLIVTVPLSLTLAPHGWSYDHLYLLLPAARLLAHASVLVRGATVLVMTVGGWALYLIAQVRGGEELSVLLPVVMLVLTCVVLTHERLGSDGTLMRASCQARPCERS